MTTPPNNDWLDDLLKEEPEYIDDAGFSAKIVSALPSHAKLLWRRRLILGIATFCALLAASFILPSFSELGQRLQSATGYISVSWSMALMVLALLAAVSAVSCIFYASHEE